MKTYQQFREEQSAEPMIEFFEKRKKGAAKIGKEARAKGGPSILTAWHFEAKAVPYEEVLSAIKNKKDENFFKSKFEKFLAQMSPSLDEEQFQKKMGELEVWGETYAKLYK